MCIRDRALAELDRMASRLELPKTVREAAAVNYKKAVDKRLIRGRSIEGVAAASLYAACRQCGVPRTLDEIGQASRTGRKEIGRTYRFMVRELKMKIMPTGPEDYISRFCSGLGLDSEVEAKAYELIKAAQEKELTSGRGPTGIAASIIYIASVLCGKRRTQREVAEVAGVTEVTIRNRYKELIQNLNNDLSISPEERSRLVRAWRSLRYPRFKRLQRRCLKQWNVGPSIGHFQTLQ